MPQSSLRVAIVGAGLMGEMHARAAKHCGATVVAIGDGDAGRARSLASRINAETQAFAPEEVIRLGDVDVIHVCTPPEEHYPLCERILSASRSVLCEKPLARTAPEVRKLIALGAQQGVAICPVHQFPFQSGVAETARHMERIGSTVHLSAEMCSAGALGRDANGTMTLALDILTHALSLFRKFGVAAVEKVAWTVVVPRAGELLVTGASAGVGLSAMISTSGRPTSSLFRVVGTRGTATIDLYHGFSVIEDGTVSRTRKAMRPFTSSVATFGAAAKNGVLRAISAETAFPGLRALVGAFYDAVEKRAPAPILPEEIIDIAVARDTIIQLSRDRFPEP